MVGDGLRCVLDRFGMNQSASGAEKATVKRKHILSMTSEMQVIHAFAHIDEKREKEQRSNDREEEKSRRERKLYEASPR